MDKLLLLPFFVLLLPALVSAQSSPKELNGAWETTFLDAAGNTNQLTMTIMDNYLVMTAFSEDRQEFMATLGGPYRADFANLTLTYDFDTSDSTNVGGTTSMSYTLNGSVLVFNNDKTWQRVDDATGPGSLAGAWQITGRKRDGEMQRRETSGPRKTVKILSGSRFQWIAFNNETAQFMGTGGGSYSTDEDAELYIEKIEFFSRDSARVGDQLSFDYKVRNKEWHHSGLSSKGDPIYETWGRKVK